MAKANLSILPFPTEINRHDFANYLTGFSDGEGCFQLRICTLHKKHGPSRPTPSAIFVICLRADDVAILQLFQSFFGCGRIVPGKGNGTRQDSRRFQISGAHDLVSTVIPHFQRYPLRAKKLRDFSIWKQGVMLIRHVSSLFRPKHSRRWTDERLAQFLALKKALASVREYQAPAIPLLPPPPPPEPSLFDDL